MKTRCHYLRLHVCIDNRLALPQRLFNCAVAERPGNLPMTVTAAAVQCASALIKHLHDRQTVRINFVDKKKEANTSQNCALVCMRFVASAVSTSHLLSFVSMSQFAFYKIPNCVFLNMLKSASPCQKADEPQPTKNSSKQKNVSRTEKRYVGDMLAFLVLQKRRVIN